MENDLKNLTLTEIEPIVTNFGQKKYLAKYIFNFIHCGNVQNISEITPLNKTFRNELAEGGFYISHLKLLEKLTDPDCTIKYLFGLSGGDRIEAVLLFDEDRRTLCVSTQAGCQMNCAFCATGKLGFKQNLSAAQIVDQVNIIEKEQGKISNVVYMGMGEPFKNYQNVLKSVHILNSPDGKNIGIRRVTISTCGEIPGLEKLADENIQPRLAISLNAPTDVLRTKIMPINKKCPLEQLFKAIKTYQLRTKQRVTFEYVMIAGFNDTVLHAKMLIKRLRGIKCNVNLIEFNPHKGCEFAASTKEAIKRFASILDTAEIETVIRFKKGRTIKAACGQLGADWPNSAS